MMKITEEEKEFYNTGSMLVTILDMHLQNKTPKEISLAWNIEESKVKELISGDKFEDLLNTFYELFE